MFETIVRSRCQDEVTLESLVPTEIMRFVRTAGQKAIPAIAKDRDMTDIIQQAVRCIPTTHRLVLGDSRTMPPIAEETVQLALTSPPYWTLKRYPIQEGQLGLVTDYEEFLAELDSVWNRVYRLLVPGGRLIIVVGDVCLSRRQHGRHVVVPLHAGIQEHCRRVGFDNLAPIIWYKISNAKFEVQNGSKFLGKPYEPNAIIKNDTEYILFQRKPGGYRRPTLAARTLSAIPSACYQAWFQQIWTIGGASTRRHPAPFPLELAERLIRMYSFAGDTVFDPFMGTGTTNSAAAHWGRNSIGAEIERSYYDMAVRNVQRGCSQGLQSRLPTDG